MLKAYNKNTNKYTLHIIILLYLFNIYNPLNVINIKIISEIF